MTVFAERRAAAALLILRLSTAAFLALWTSIKFVKPEGALSIYEKFYKPIFQIDVPMEAFVGVGVVQALIVLLFALGAMKFWSYLAVLIMHGVSTFSTWPQFMAMGEGHNLLYFTAVPVLAGCLALFLMRDLDRYAVGR